MKYFEEELSLPLAISLVCTICGDYTLLQGDSRKDFWPKHLAARDHVRGHNEKVDLEGVEIVRGYGWTDQYVAVNAYETEDEVAQFLVNLDNLKNGCKSCGSRWTHKKNCPELKRRREKGDPNTTGFYWLAVGEEI